MWLLRSTKPETFAKGPIRQSSPMTVPDAIWEPSKTCVFLPIQTGPLIRAPGEIVAPSPTNTGPSTCALGSTRAVSAICESCRPPGHFTQGQTTDGQGFPGHVHVEAGAVRADGGGGPAFPEHERQGIGDFVALGRRDTVLYICYKIRRTGKVLKRVVPEYEKARQRGAGGRPGLPRVVDDVFPGIGFPRECAG